MNSDPAFADYEAYGPPDRLLRDDEIDEAFIKAVGDVGATLPGRGHAPPEAQPKTTRREIPASKVKALADRLRKVSA
jgi:hypothetical protein